MKRIIIIILVLIVVVLGGAGGLMMLGVVRNPFGPPPKAGAEAISAPKASANAPTAQLELVKVPDMTIPVIIDGKVNRQVSIGMRLAVTKAGRARVEADVKAVTKDEKGGKLGRSGSYQDALLTELYGYFREHFRTHDTLDIDAIGKKARAAAEKTFGEDVTDVLLTNVFESGIASGGKGTFAPSE